MGRHGPEGQFVSLEVVWCCPSLRCFRCEMTQQVKGAIQAQAKAAGCLEELLDWVKKQPEERK